jgi:hypothetical protein
MLGMSTHKLTPCKFPVVTHLNNGEEVPPETMCQIFEVLNRQYGGYTVLGVREGCWEGQVETSIWIEVAVPVERIAELRMTVYAIGKKLGQKAMLLDAPEPSVEIFPIDE